jgi:uroporphyrinogen-III synthase
VGARFSHVFISRPRTEARELAALLQPMGLQPIVQPAFDFLLLDAREDDPETCSLLEAAGPGDLLVFTSPRAVAFGLEQFSHALLSRFAVTAVGPATAAALSAAGLPPTLSPGEGYTSESLLQRLTGEPTGRAFVLAAPGGRDALVDGLAAAGWKASRLMVYRSEPATLDPAALEQLAEAGHVLSIWTSGNAMKSLSQRLPPAAWFKLCSGEWLVISDRLQRLARAYGPARIHRSEGPGNGAVQSAVRHIL